MRNAAATDPAIGQLIGEDDRRRYLTPQALVDLIIDDAPDGPAATGTMPPPLRPWFRAVTDTLFGATGASPLSLP